jgi:membrane associated rhomboid family serine protease
VFLASTVSYGAVIGLFGAFPDGESLAAVLSIGALSGLVFGLAMTYWVRRIRRRSGLAELEPGSQRSLYRVLRTGQAPADRSLYPE